MKTAARPPKASESPAVSLQGAALDFGNGRAPLWSELNLQVHPGEFVAVLGGNGSGKTTLLRCLLGLLPLTAGTLRINGQSPRIARSRIGYVPQQQRIDPLTPLRARDLVGFGFDGHRWGLGGRGREAAIGAALAVVGAIDLADRAVADLSGGQQQLVRIAQALVCDPALLLCDEPLLSLDLHHQRVVASVINQRRLTHNTPVMFVTHEINPILPYVDRVLYLARGRFRIGSVAEVMTSQVLSDLYQAPVEVVRVGERIIVVGIPEANESDHHHPVAAGSA